LGEKLILRRYISEEQLTKNKYGIMEPDSTCPSIVTASIDLFIIPGVAFGLDGYRLGHGKGYYDRLLSNTKSPVIGICFESQVFATVPHSANDGKVDIIVTEKQTYDLKNHHTPYKPFS